MAPQVGLTWPEFSLTRLQVTLPWTLDSSGWSTPSVFVVTIPAKTSALLAGTSSRWIGFAETPVIGEHSGPRVLERAVLFHHSGKEERGLSPRSATSDGLNGNQRNLRERVGWYQGSILSSAALISAGLNPTVLIPATSTVRCSTPMLPRNCIRTGSRIITISADPPVNDLRRS